MRKIFSSFSPFSQISTTYSRLCDLFFERALLETFDYDRTLSDLSRLDLAFSKCIVLDPMVSVMVSLSNIMCESLHVRSQKGMGQAAFEALDECQDTVDYQLNRLLILVFSNLERCRTEKVLADVFIVLNKAFTEDLFIEGAGFPSLFYYESSSDIADVISFLGEPYFQLSRRGLDFDLSEISNPPEVTLRFGCCRLNIPFFQTVYLPAYGRLNIASLLAKPLGENDPVLKDLRDVFKQFYRSSVEVDQVLLPTFALLVKGLRQILDGDLSISQCAEEVSAALPQESGVDKDRLQALYTRFVEKMSDDAVSVAPLNSHSAADRIFDSVGRSLMPFALYDLSYNSFYHPLVRYLFEDDDLLRCVYSDLQRVISDGVCLDEHSFRDVMSPSVQQLMRGVMTRLMSEPVYAYLDSVCLDLYNGYFKEITGRIFSFLKLRQQGGLSFELFRDELALYVDTAVKRLAVYPDSINGLRKFVLETVYPNRVFVVDSNSGEVDLSDVDVSVLSDEPVLLLAESGQHWAVSPSFQPTERQVDYAAFLHTKLQMLDFSFQDFNGAQAQLSQMIDYEFAFPKSSIYSEPFLKFLKSLRSIFSLSFDDVHSLNEFPDFVEQYRDDVFLGPLLAVLLEKWPNIVLRFLSMGDPYFIKQLDGFLFSDLRQDGPAAWSKQWLGFLFSNMDGKSLTMHGNVYMALLGSDSLMLVLHRYPWLLGVLKTTLLHLSADEMGAFVKPVRCIFEMPFVDHLLAEGDDELWQVKLKFLGESIYLSHPQCYERLSQRIDVGTQFSKVKRYLLSLLGENPFMQLQRMVVSDLEVNASCRLTLLGIVKSIIEDYVCESDGIKQYRGVLMCPNVFSSIQEQLHAWRETFTDETIDSGLFETDGFRALEDQLLDRLIIDLNIPNIRHLISEVLNTLASARDFETADPIVSFIVSEVLAYFHRFHPEADLDRYVLRNLLADMDELFKPIATFFFEHMLPFFYGADPSVLPVLNRRLYSDGDSMVFVDAPFLTSGTILLREQVLSVDGQVSAAACFYRIADVSVFA